MHRAAFEYVAQPKPRPRTHIPTVVELGSRNVNGSVRGLFRGWRYIGVDLLPGPGVDVVADAATYDPGEQVDLVLCCETLEHTPDAETIIANAHRMLLTWGTLIVTTAGPGRQPHSAIDGKTLRPGEFYRNVTRDLLIQWLAPFGKRFEIDETPIDLRATAWKGVAQCLA